MAWSGKDIRMSFWECLFKTNQNGFKSEASIELIIGNYFSYLAHAVYLVLYYKLSLEEGGLIL